MVFCAFRDGDVNGREEFALAEKDQKPVISAKEEVIDGTHRSGTLTESLPFVAAQEQQVYTEVGHLIL